MKSLLLAACVVLSACELPSEYYAASASGNVVHEKRWGQLGGTRSSHRADGSSEVNDHQTSLRDGATAAIGIAGAVANVRNVSSDNALTATQNTNAANQSAAKLKAANDALKIKSTPTIITPPQQAVFPPP